MKEYFKKLKPDYHDWSAIIGQLSILIIFLGTLAIVSFCSKYEENHFRNKNCNKILTIKQ